MSQTTLPSAPVATAFPWLALLILSSTVFLAISSEMLPTGLLPEMSSDFGVTESQIGLLVSWFAFTVVISSAPLTHLTRRFSRHGLVVAVLFAFALSNVMSAFAPSYEFAVVSRVIGGLAHGLFWAVVGAYASYLVPKAQIGRAVSITVAGGTLAFVFGVPLGTAAGQVLGWRLSFIVLAGLMLVGALLVWLFLPRVNHVRPTADGAGAALTKPTGLRGDPTVSPVILICSITALIMVGHYTFYTYIVPFLTDEMNVGTAGVAPYLFVFGVAGAVSLVLVGTIFGSRPQSGLVAGVGACIVSVTVLVMFPENVVVAFVAFALWGIAFGVIPPLLQTTLLHTASLQFRDVGSAMYTTGFNVGIGSGALLGALLVRPAGVIALPIVNVGILVAALLLILVSNRVIRRRALAERV
ncbi:MFS transporter [Glaciibacter psychrotolerans]|uniref:Putative MFS family arabinose efflux permease n=1 Tax=Glaciibacter psychrotolerans TaxID=670054 RepID=A0A7Z0J7U5_9MICO|nr:MFS transporter [Leifsonia psychrotolerans]NYJ21666.1 putative MFS family arabinose efflux permease [Leifsonia psychrotolerans]